MTIYKTIPYSLQWDCLSPASVREYYSASEAVDSEEYGYLKPIIEVKKANRSLGEYFGHYLLSPEEYAIVENLLKNCFSAYEMQGFIKGFEEALRLISECETV